MPDVSSFDVEAAKIRHLGRSITDTPYILLDARWTGRRRPHSAHLGRFVAHVWWRRRNHPRFAEWRRPASKSSQILKSNVRYSFEICERKRQLCSTNTRGNKRRVSPAITINEEYRIWCARSDIIPYLFGIQNFLYQSWSGGLCSSIRLLGFFMWIWNIIYCIMHIYYLFLSKVCRKILLF
jgi:hypothetical protein